MQRVSNLSFGDAGTAQTVAAMRRLVNDSLTDPVVVGTGRSIAASCVPRDIDCQISQIAEWARDHFMFVRDPGGVETLSTPRFMLDTIATRVYAQGDCDEAAILTAAIGKSIGIPARFILLGFAGPTGPMAHVFTSLRGSRSWISLDVTRPARGYLPAASRYSEVEV